jgi:hypothetical protein
MKTVVILTNERQREIIYGKNKKGWTYLLDGDTTVMLSGDVQKDSLRLHQATNCDNGVKLVNFSVYMQREVVEKLGKWHLEELKDEIRSF